MRKDSDRSLMDVTIEPFDPVSPYFEGAVQVYVRTWPHESQTARGIFLQHHRYPDYRALVALVDGRVVGMGYGARSESGQWWHDRVAAHVGAGHPALQHAWSLIELAVLPEYRDRGIGGRLHDALLLAVPCPRALLSTEAKNEGARRFYERRGWEYLHPGFAFVTGKPLFVIMHKELAT